MRAVEKAGIKYQGRIDLDGRMIPNFVLRDHPRARPGDTDSSAPSYELFVVRDGRETVAGAAWIKNSEKVEGGDFMSLTLDNIRWPRPLNLTAFPPDSKSTTKDWTIVWSRPRAARVQDETAPDFEEETA